MRIRQLDVITVDFGVATTFSQFFEDNLKNFADDVALAVAEACSCADANLHS